MSIVNAISPLDFEGNMNQDCVKCGCFGQCDSNGVCTDCLFEEFEDEQWEEYEQDGEEETEETEENED